MSKTNEGLKIAVQLVRDRTARMDRYSIISSSSATRIFH